MEIVAESKLPTRGEIKDVSLDNLEELWGICFRLEELCKNENGIGIAAAQAGIPVKIFLVRGDGTCPFLKENEFGYFLNCSYEPVTEEKCISLEGCLSLRSPDGCLRFFHVQRYKTVRVTGKRLFIDKINLYSIIDLDAEVTLDQQGAVFQHEADHNLGILISDHGKELFLGDSCR